MPIPLLVVCRDIINIKNWIRLMVDGKKRFGQSLVEGLKHGIEAALSIAIDEFFDANYPANSHILGYLNGIGTPWSDHFLARTYKLTLPIDRPGSFWHLRKANTICLYSFDSMKFGFLQQSFCCSFEEEDHGAGFNGKNVSEDREKTLKITNYKLQIKDL